MDSWAWIGLGAPTHLLHTMAMTTTAMRKTRPAAEEPIMSGSFSWMLVWYSAGGESMRSVVSLALGVLMPPPSCEISWDPQTLFLLLRQHLSHAQMENEPVLTHT